MKIKFYNRLVAEDLVDFLNAKTKHITMESGNIVLKTDKNSWMYYKYDNPNMMESDMEEIMNMRLSLDSRE